jgi:hypothetical protein
VRKSYFSLRRETQREDKCISESLLRSKRIKKSSPLIPLQRGRVKNQSFNIISKNVRKSYFSLRRETQREDK